MAKTHAEVAAAANLALLESDVFAQAVAKAAALLIGADQAAVKEAPARPVIEVRMNDAEQLAQFGTEITVGKLTKTRKNPKGTFIPKVGVHKDQLRQLAADLIAAADLLEA